MRPRYALDNPRPKGVGPVIARYADAIAEAVAPWGAVDFGAPLGCGSFGCVYSLYRTPFVVKISLDPTEGPVTRAIMDTGLDKRLDGLVRFEAIWKIPIPIFPTGRRRYAWVIVREDVEPFGKWFPTWAHALNAYNEAARVEVRLRTPWRRKVAREVVEEALGRLYEHKAAYYMAEAIEELRRHDIVLADVHRGNVGYRIHDWTDGQEATTSTADERPLLIFDPGHSSCPEGTIVPEMVLGARENPDDIEDLV